MVIGVIIMTTLSEAEIFVSCVKVDTRLPFLHSQPWLYGCSCAIGMPSLHHVEKYVRACAVGISGNLLFTARIVAIIPRAIVDVHHVADVVASVQCARVVTNTVQLVVRCSTFAWVIYTKRKRGHNLNRITQKYICHFNLLECGP